MAYKKFTEYLENTFANGKVAIYVRVSTDHQVDKDSLPTQKKDLINYCKLILGIEDYIVFLQFLVHDCKVNQVTADTVQFPYK